MNLSLKRLKNDFGIDWHKSFLDKMFLNPFYYGVMEIKGKQYSHKYPPIITKLLYDQVQKIKNNFNKRKISSMPACRTYIGGASLRRLRVGYNAREA